MFFITENYTDRSILGKNLKIRSKDCPLPVSATMSDIKELMPYKFRLLDDDKEVHYEGYYDGLNEEAEIAFAPLDWAMNYTGCTEMQFIENGKWVQL